MTFDYTKDGGPTWTGLAASKELSGDRFIWAAYGTPKTIGFVVYKIAGGKLSGNWHPWYGGNDAKNEGHEELQGPDTLDGDFQIVSAKAPSTGAAYTGTVTIKPLTIVGADDEEKPYSLVWTIGTVKVQGIGIRTKDYLYVASGTGGGCEHRQIQDGKRQRVVFRRFLQAGHDGHGRLGCHRLSTAASPLLSN